METKRRKLNVLPPHEDKINEEEKASVGLGRFPKWLHRKLPAGNLLWKTQKILAEKRLPTVCEEAKCPNLMECWSRKTATFLAMGKTCTRSCGFCDIDFSKNPKKLEEDEPKRLAESIKALGLKHSVITMVARDDLPDGGASHLTRIIEEVKKLTPPVTIEVLTSDFAGNFKTLNQILDTKLEIFNHNVETVSSLTPRVRHLATYERSLAVLRYAKQNSSGTYIKSGLMIGLGEKEEEVLQTIDDLHAVGCDIITIGQYLQANRKKLRVKAFITPKLFENYAAYGHSIGVKYMYTGPFVRSSYNAASLFEKLTKK